MPKEISLNVPAARTLLSINNVDNTNDLNKPVSDAVEAELTLLSESIGDVLSGLLLTGSYFRPVVLTQPITVTGNSGESLQVSCLGGIIPNTHLTLSYQWQISTDSGVTFGNVSGATNPALPFAPALVANSAQYRCRITNQLGTQDTNAVSMTVGTNPAALFGALDQGIAWDLDRIDHLFQTATGGLPVAAYGDPVGLILTLERGGLDNLGAELVTNGTFESNIAGWTIGTSGSGVPASWSDGVIICQRTNGSNTTSATQSFATVAGRRYRLVISATGSNGRVITSTTNGGSDLYANSSFTGVLTAFFNAITSTTWVRFDCPSDAGSTSFDNVSVREVPGNHLIQATSARRPTYARRPKSGVRNLLQRTEEFDNAYWTKVNATATANSLVENATNAEHRLQNNTTTAFVSGTTYTISFEVKASGRTRIRLGFADTTPLPGRAFFSLTGAGSFDNAIAGTTATITALPDDWYRVSVRTTCTGNISSRVELNLVQTTTVAIYAGDGTSGILVRNAQLETGLTATAYQRVTNQFDVTEVGQPSINYLWLDGIDDCMVSSAAINFSNSDEMTVCMGARKLDDTGSPTLIEMSAFWFTNNGSVVFTKNTNLPQWQYASRGTATAPSGSLTVPTGETLMLLTGESKISTDLVRIRNLQGAFVSSEVDQGTGNYGNHVVNLGSRNQATNFFQGHINSGFIVNRLLPPSVLADYERHFVAAKAGIDLP